MSTRDEFSAEVKRSLAHRVGFICSYPDCNALTTGPSAESTKAINSSGMACHISSAAGGPGARRFNPTMTSEERTSIENGIWMCYSHGHIIDNDEKRFTIDVLEKWKIIAELKAQFRNENKGRMDIPIDVFKGLNLPEQEFILREGDDFNKLVGDAIRDSCISTLWGQEYTGPVRDLLIEMVLNSFKHGGAKQVEVNIKNNVIEVIDNGKKFDPLTLYQGTKLSGGTCAVKIIIDQFEGRILATYDRVGYDNKVILGFIRSGEFVTKNTDCWTSVQKSDAFTKSVDINVSKNCNAIYLFLREYICISDVIRLSHSYKPQLFEGKIVVFIVNTASVKVRDILRKAYPGCKVLVLED